MPRPLILPNGLCTTCHGAPPAAQERFPEFEFEPGADLGCTESLDNSKAEKELGLQLRPVKEAICDMAVTLIQLGLAAPKPCCANGRA